MKTFEQIVQSIYGTDDDMGYICHRMTDDDILWAVNLYAEQVAKDTLYRASQGDRTTESILSTDIILLGSGSPMSTTSANTVYNESRPARAGRM